ncbi:Catenin Alpha-1 [Manis pentadactyla]|nr:Catenin Alpha-1 [Manis pentadactyla]
MWTAAPGSKGFLPAQLHYCDCPGLPRGATRAVFVLFCPLRRSVLRGHPGTTTARVQELQTQPSWGFWEDGEVGSCCPEDLLPLRSQAGTTWNTSRSEEDHSQGRRESLLEREGPLALGKHRLVESVLSSTAHNARVTNGPQEGDTEEVACVLLAGEDCATKQRGGSSRSRSSSTGRLLLTLPGVQLSQGCWLCSAPSGGSFPSVAGLL